MVRTTAAGWLRTHLQSFIRVERAIAVLSLLVALALCGLFGLASRSTTLSVAAPSSSLPRDGVYLVESFPEQTGVYQWVTANSWFQIPNPGGALLLRLDLLGGPAGATPIQLRTKQIMQDIVVAPNLRTYHLLLPPSTDMGIWLAINTPTVEVGQRDLGIAVSTIAVAGGQSIPLRLILAFLVANLALYRLFHTRPLWAGFGLLVFQGLALWWYQAGGWVIPNVGLALAAVAAPCATAIALGSCWPIPAPKQRATGRVILAFVIQLCLLIGALSLGFLLIIDRNVIALILPIGLASATVGSYAILRQVRLPVILTIIAVLFVQLMLLGMQALLGWQVPMIGVLAGMGGALCLIAVVLERWLPPMPPISMPSIAWTNRDTWITSIILGLGLSVRLLWIAAPDPAGDIELAARRMGLLQANGLAGAYSYDGDYMPLWLYSVYGLSYCVVPLGGQFFDPLPPITRAIIKFPSIIADLTTAGLIYWWARRWGSQRNALLIAVLYTLSPPIWINSAWWGQADTLLMLPLVGTLMLFDRAGGRWSWLLWAIAQATKPQAIVLLPVLAVLTIRRYGCRGLLQGCGIALATLLAVILPLVAAGQSKQLYDAVFTSVGRFPSVTNGAYNVGYLLTGRSHIDDTDLWLGLITYRLFGLCLLSGTTLLICVSLLRRSDSVARFLAAATLALAFALLPTQIHERYLFLPLAFLVLCICLDRSYAVPYVVLMISATLNIFGDLSGFWPAAAAAIRATPLPSMLAISNIMLLLVLLWRLAMPARDSRLPIA